MYEIYRTTSIVTFPRLNVPHGGTQDGTQGGTQDDTQGDAQGDTQGDTQDVNLDIWIESQLNLGTKSGTKFGHYSTMTRPLLVYRTRILEEIRRIHE